MKVLYLIIPLLLCSCSRMSSDTAATQEIVDDALLQDSTGNTLVRHVREHGLKSGQIEEIQSPVEFSSGDSGDVSFYRFQFEYEGRSYELISEFSSTPDRGVNPHRSIYIDSDKARIVTNDTVFDSESMDTSIMHIDSMDLNVIYTESSLYRFKSNPGYLLIRSGPMNWVGTMTRLDFFQLINSQDKPIIEFIEEDG